MMPLPDPGESPSDADAEAARWCVRQRDGLNADEARALQAWLAADPSNPQRLQRMQQAWGGLGALPPAAVARWRAQGAPAARPQRVRRRLLLHASGLAVAGVLGTVGTVAGLGWWHVQQQPVFWQQFASARGQQLALELPDGSRLRLDTLTRVQVVFYRDRRDVHLLQGRAFFDVRRDPARPFSVQAAAVRVVVVGTRFCVDHRPDTQGAKGVQVVVEEGEVRLSGTGAAAAAASPPALPEESLRAGEAWQQAGDGTVRRGADAQAGRDALAWREGRLVLRNVTLAEAIAEFERYGDTRLVLADPALAGLRLSGSFGQREIRAFRTALPQVLPVRLSPRTDGAYDVVRAP